MQLYLGEGSREHLPLIKKAVQAWNGVFGRDIIELKEDMVNYAFGPPPYKDSSFYSDGVSVIYLVDPVGAGGYALPRQRFNSESGSYEIYEADVFADPAGQSPYTLSTITHELGHALGLGHIPVSGNIMSYDRPPVIEDRLDPFVRLGAFPKYGTNPPSWYASYLFEDPDHVDLMKNLVRPQVQDLAALSCLYDFATWGQ